jgi:hypothetical protein
MSSYQREKAEGKEGAEEGNVSMVEILQPQDAAERGQGGGQGVGEQQALLSAAKPEPSQVRL